MVIVYLHNASWNLTSTVAVLIPDDVLLHMCNMLEVIVVLWSWAQL